MSRDRRETRVAPNVLRTASGWRVSIRHPGGRHRRRFPPDATLAQLTQYVDAFKDELEQLRVAARERRGTLAADADRYLALAVVRAMPSYVDRSREIARWVEAFGTRPRATITARAIDEQLEDWRALGAAPASLNKYRTALMSLYTRLDGRGAANPVRETRVFPEPPAQAKGRSFAVIRAVLDAMPHTRSRPTKGKKGSASRGSKTHARLCVLAWTGMTPAQLKLLERRHVNLREQWFITPPRAKGQRRPRHTRPEIKKPMTADAVRAFQRFVEVDAWGPFDTRAMRHTLERARLKAERTLKQSIPRLTPYDLRHSFATELYRATRDLALVAEWLDHSSTAMTKRYAHGAVSDVLAHARDQLEAAVGGPTFARPRRG